MEDSHIESLKRHFVASKIDALIFLEFVCKIIDKPKIEILSAQMRVTVCGFHLENTFTDFQDGDIKGTPA